MNHNSAPNSKFSLTCRRALSSRNPHFDFRRLIRVAPHSSLLHKCISGSTVTTEYPDAPATATLA